MRLSFLAKNNKAEKQEQFKDQYVFTMRADIELLRVEQWLMVSTIWSGIVFGLLDCYV